MSANVTVPASDLDAEAAVLSTMLEGSDCVDEVRAIVSPEDFYSQANARICRTIFALDEVGQPVDTVTVASKLRDDGHLDAVGGTPYLAQVVGATPVVAHVETHARIVANKALRRRLVDTLRRALIEVAPDDGDPAADAQQVAAALELAIGDKVGNRDKTLRGHVMTVMAEVEARYRGEQVSAGQSTGFWELDDQLAGGLKRGVCYVVAARPGMGKTSLALQLTRQPALEGKGSVFVSYEMPEEQLVSRLLSLTSSVSVSRIMGSRLGRDEMGALIEAASTVPRLPIHLTHVAGSAFEARSAVRRGIRSLRREHKADLDLGLVVVDYLQLMRSPGHGNRENEVSESMGAMVQLAKEFDVPVVVLSQLNRALESRQNKRPQLSDLRESGAIEQDAYAVIFLYRDDYYRPDDPPTGEAEAIVAKHRNGQVGTVKMKFDGKRTMFADAHDDPRRFANEDFGPLKYDDEGDET